MEGSQCSTQWSQIISTFLEEPFKFFRILLVDGRDALFYSSIKLLTRLSLEIQRKQLSLRIIVSAVTSISTSRAPAYATPVSRTLRDRRSSWLLLSYRLSSRSFTNSRYGASQSCEPTPLAGAGPYSRFYCPGRLSSRQTLTRYFKTPVAV